MNHFDVAGAFVLQLRTDTDFVADHIQGRVEHVASGRTAHFESATELLAVLARLWPNAPREVTRWNTEGRTS
jgi:hypothetical protein